MKIHPSEKFPYFTERELMNLEETIENKKEIFKDDVEAMLKGAGFKTVRVPKLKKRGKK